MSRKGKAPAFPFYAADWLADMEVATMTLAQKGAYVDLLCYQWREGALPNDPGRLATMLRVTRREFSKKLWPALERFFPDSGEKNRRNLRLERERAAMLDVREMRRKSADSRWQQHANAMRMQVHSQCSASASASASAGKTTDASPSVPPVAAATVPPHEQQQPLELENPKAPARRAKGLPDVGELVTRYSTRWVEMYKPDDGKPPRLDRKDRAQAGRIVREYGLEKATAFVTRYLDDPDSWLVERRHPLSLILRKVNEYRTTPPSRRTSGTAAKNTTKWLEPIDALAKTEDVKL